MESGDRVSAFHAIKKYKFIELNSTERISWMVFDLDSPPKPWIDTAQKIQDYMRYVLDLPLPTYITKTDRGFHVAYLLKFGIRQNDHQAYAKYRLFRSKLAHILGADPHHLKDYGIYRNPLFHEHIYNQTAYWLTDLLDAYTDKDDTILDPVSHQIAHDDSKSLSSALNSEIKKLLYKVLTLNKPKKVVTVGARKSVFFQATMLYAKQKKRPTMELLMLYLKNLQAYALKELPEHELKNIAVSVLKYKKADAIYVADPTKAKEKVLHFKEGTSTRERQSCGADYANAIKKQKSVAAITNAIKELYKKGAKITKAQIAKTSGRSYRTVLNHSKLIEKILLDLSKKTRQNAPICFFIKAVPSLFLLAPSKKVTKTPTRYHVHSPPP